MFSAKLGFLDTFSDLRQKTLENRLIFAGSRVAESETKRIERTFLQFFINFLLCLRNIS